MEDSGVAAVNDTTVGAPANDTDADTAPSRERLGFLISYEPQGERERGYYQQNAEVAIQSPHNRRRQIEAQPITAGLFD